MTADPERTVVRLRSGRPRVSVVVTAYNYGHFLESCLDSLNRQIRPADEIVVVNDGSTDGTEAVLARWPDLDVIHQENRGQAAAFNAGFAATTGDLVIFLDADDRLKPEAIAVISRLWSDEVSCFCFGLEMIDSQGVPAGAYDMRVPEADLLPRLLRDLGLPFMPTSGNAFRREAISWAFPLPEPRWKISADAVLIRAALYAAPIRHLPHTLGEYRIHRHNNWFRDVASDDWRVQRGRADIAQTGIELVRLAPKSPHGLDPALRLSLLLAAISSQVRAYEQGDGKRGLVPFVREAWSLRPKGNLRASLLLLALRASAPRSRMVRYWIADRAARPRWIDRALSWFIGTAFDRSLAEAMEHRPTFGCQPSAGAAGRGLIDAHFASRAWSRHWSDQYYDLCRETGSLRIQRTRSAAVELLLDLEPPVGCLADVLISQDGSTIARFELAARGGIPIQLAGTRAVAPEADRLDFRVMTRPVEGARWRHSMFAPSRRLRIHGIGLNEPERRITGAVLPVGWVAPFPTIAASLGADADGEGVTSLTLAAPHLAPPFCLDLHLSQTQCEGWLSVSIETREGARMIYSGQVAGWSRILAEIGADALETGWPITIQTGFLPDNPLDSEAVRIASLGWQPGGASVRDGTPLLSPGAWITAANEEWIRKYLVGDWVLSDVEPRFYRHTAGITFATEDHGGSNNGPLLRLDLAPERPFLGDESILLAVSINGENRQALRLAGRDEIEIAIDQDVAITGGTIEVGIHAIGQSEDGNPDPHGGIILYGFGLVGSVPDATVLQQSVSVPSIGLRLSGVAAIQPDRMSPDALADLARELASEIATLTSRALEDFLTPVALERLAAIGRHAAIGAGSENEQLIRTDMSGDPPEWLRGIALAMLRGPGWSSAPDLLPSRIPDCDPGYVGPIGTWLTAPPSLASGVAGAERYAIAMTALLADACGALSARGKGTFPFKLADCCLRGIDRGVVAPASSSSAALADAFGAAIEAALLRDGRGLWHPDRRTGIASGRIGLLLRDAGSLRTGHRGARLAEALQCRELDIFLTDGHPEEVPSSLPGCRLFTLQRQSLSAAVREIRNRSLDRIIVADRLDRADTFTRIAAHHLAAEQIAIWPATPAGLESTDAVVRSAVFADSDAPFVRGELRAPGLGYLPKRPGAVPPPRGLLRTRLGLADDGFVVLIALGTSFDSKTLSGLIRQLIDASEDCSVMIAAEAGIATISELGALRAAVAPGLEALANGNDRLRWIAPSPVQGLSEFAAAADFAVIGSAPGTKAISQILEIGLPGGVFCEEDAAAAEFSKVLGALGLQDLVAGQTDRLVAHAQDCAAERPARASDMATALSHAREQAELQVWISDRLGASVARPSPRYLFHHMPKTAGTSLRYMFASWFDVATDYREWWGKTAPAALDLSKIPPGGMLWGHFGTDGIPLKTRYPETLDPEAWRWITFVRDPLEQALSYYSFERETRPKHDPEFKPVPLSEFLGTWPGLYLRHFECGPEDWRDALDRYWFIGTIERLEHCLEHLARVIGRPPLEILHYHRTRDRLQPDPADVEAFIRRNGLAFEIYREIDRRLSETLGEPVLDRLKL